MNKEKRQQMERHRRLMRNTLEARYYMFGAFQFLYFFGLPDKVSLDDQTIRLMTVAYRDRIDCRRCKFMNGFIIREQRLVFVMQCHNAEYAAIDMHEAMAAVGEFDRDLVFETGRKLYGGRKKSYRHRIGSAFLTRVNDVSHPSRSRAIGRNSHFNPAQAMLFETIVDDDDG